MEGKEGWKYIGELRSKGNLVLVYEKGEEVRVDRVMLAGRELEPPSPEERGRIYRELRR